MKLNHPDAAIGLLAPVVLKHLNSDAYRSHLLKAMEQQGSGSAQAERVKAALRQNPTEENQRELRTAIEGVAGCNCEAIAAS